MARKTYPVRELVERANRIMRQPTVSDELRLGVEAILMEVLHETGTYAGFGYVDHEGTPRQWTEDAPEHPRAYYLHRSLRAS